MDDINTELLVAIIGGIGGVAAGIIASRSSLKTAVQSSAPDFARQVSDLLSKMEQVSEKNSELREQVLGYQKANESLQDEIKHLRSEVQKLTKKLGGTLDEDA